jgi:hypothetical protein
MLEVSKLEHRSRPGFPFRLIGSCFGWRPRDFAKGSMGNIDCPIGLDAHEIRLNTRVTERSAGKQLESQALLCAE